MKKKIFTNTFIISASISLVLAIISLINTDTLSSILSIFQVVFAVEYGWLGQIIPLICLIVLFYLGFSKKYGHIKLGGENSKPEYSTFAWIGMLFTGAIGMGLMSFAVNEPLYAYLLSPSAIDAQPNVMEAAKQAMVTSMYHWGASTWSIGALAGLVVAYFVSKHNGRYLPGDAILKTWPHKKWSKGLSNFINVLACIAALTTISASMGIGVVQLTSGMASLFNLSEFTTEILPYIFLAILAFFCILSSATKKVGKGMNIISNINIYVCIFVLIFVFVFGPTRFIFENIVQTLGSYIFEFIPRSTDMFIFGTDKALLTTGLSYLTSWDVVNNLFWICWAPFMAVFIASISKGRTLKEFAICTTIVPTIFMLLWNSGIGGISLLDTLIGEGQIAANVLERADLTFFMIIKSLPFSTVMTIISVILLFMFLTTTVTSAALSLGRMTDEEGLNPEPVRCVIWVILMTCISLTSLVSASNGGADALATIKSIGSVFGYPYLFFFIMIIFAFFRQIKIDENK